MRRVAVVVLSVLCVALLGVTTNIATAALPTRWSPYAWLAWPLLVATVIALVVLEVARGRQPARVAPAGSARARRILLERVRRYWVAGVLDRSLHREARIELGITVRVDDRRHPWTAAAADGALRTVDERTSMADLFTEFDRAVLLLGAPGAGKTTLLLELARELLDQAVADPEAPIPVVANLSSWVVQRAPIERWLIEQLTDRYGMPGDQAAAWVAAGAVVPLLDGLDEVAEDHRDACVAAIAEFHRRQPLTPLAVCCRSAEYSLLGTELPVYGTLTIEPLTRRQVEEYLARAGEALAGLRTALAADPGLWELADSPLLLSIMALAYADGPEPAAPPDGSGRARLFARYVDVMLRHRPHPRYRPEQSRRYLSVLAADLTLRQQSVFVLDLITASVAPPRSPAAELVSRVAGSAGAALLLGVAGTLLLGWPGAAIGLVTGLLALRVMSNLSLSYEDLDGISVSGPGDERPQRVNWVTGLGRELAELYDQERSLLELGLLGAMVVGLGFGLHTRPDAVLAYALGHALAALITFGVTGTALRALTEAGGHPPSAGRREVPSPALRRRLGYALRVAPPLGLASGAVAGLTVAWPAGAADATRYGLLVGLSSAVFLLLLAAGAPLAEQWLVRRRLARADLVPYPLRPFLDHAVQCLLLRGVGDGYLFVHRELRDHFAGRQPGPTPVAAGAKAERPASAR